MPDPRLDVINDEIRRLDPGLETDEHAFQVAVVLMAAAFVTGPDMKRLSIFTGFAAWMIADISKRMYQAGLWESGKVEADHWFDGDKWTGGFWVDVLVAEGLLMTKFREDGERVYRRLNEQEVQ
jgi:hypothetical protein